MRWAVVRPDCKPISHREVQPMPANVEVTDRLIRTAVGIALLSVVILVSGNWRWAGLIGLVPLATGLVGWCPVYAWLSRD